MKRFLALLLCLTALCSMFTGCGRVYENSNLMTKGEFFALFITENNMYSDIYSNEEIENNDSYDIDAEIMYEWNLIDEEQKFNLDEAVTKELVAQCCVRFMAFRQECTTKIKDINMCHDKQAIIDAVGMGIFELDNGYFDAYEQMTYDDCIYIINKTSEVEGNATFDNELEIEYQDNVQNFSGVEITDIVFYENSSQSNDVTSLTSYVGEPSAVTTLAKKTNDDVKITNLLTTDFSYIEVTIPVFEYDRAPEKYKEGVPFTYNPYDLTIKRKFNNNYRPFAGVISKVEKKFSSVVITIKQCTLSQIVKDTPGINKASTTYAVPMPEDYQPQKSFDSAKEGLDLKKTSSGKGVQATFKHTFSLNDPVYTKQMWRNASASPSITITATVDNFKITTKNLGKLLLEDESATADIAVSFDTSIELDAKAGGLRYSPANNGNGKFWSNLSNSRWTGASAGGSKMIKLGKADIPIGTTGFSVSCTFYMYIQMDGSINVTVSQTNKYVCSIKNGGKVSVKNDSTSPKLNNASINTNICAGVQVNPNVNFWSFKIVDATAKAGLNLNAMASIYDKDDKPLSENVYATHTELSENSSSCSYCIHTSLSFEVSGQLLTTDSIVGKFVIKTLKLKTPSIDKSWELSQSHFEDGTFMSACSRNNTGVVQVNSNEEILLSSYKEHLNQGGETAIRITSVPINDKKISKYGGITVSTGNKKIAKATLDEQTKTLLITAVGEGSTEITIKIKKGKKSKKYYTKKISVTVTKEDIAPTSYNNDFYLNGKHIQLYC